MSGTGVRAPSPAAGDRGVAVDTTEMTLLKLPVVRELVLENERMLAEVLAFRELRGRAAAAATRELLSSEAVGRHALAASESAQRADIASAAHAALVTYSGDLEDALVEAEGRNDELQGFMALAQRNLSLHTGEEVGDDVSRRLSTSWSEKENELPGGGSGGRAADTSPPCKRVRGSTGGSDGRPSTRVLLPSPSEITKDRKTLHRADLAVSPNRRKTPRLRR